MTEVWEIFSNYLFFISYAYDVRILNFVLMNNHFHLTIHTPRANLDKAMNYFMREVSKQMTNKTQRINQTFGGPYHWCLIKKYQYLINVYKYVYRNPVEAKICTNVEDYRYSSLHGLLGQSKILFPCYDNILEEGIDHTLSWLNINHTKGEIKDIESGLKKSTFKFPKDRNTGRERQMT